jgi:peroxiredoxin
MKTIKNLTLLALLFASFNLVAQDLVPDQTLKDIDGKSVNVRELTQNGKITVMSFWATWCSPCKKELDNLMPLYAEWKEEYNVQILAITIDDARALTKVKPMVESKGWEYTILSDLNQELMRALNFQNVPYTFLVDQNGKVVYTHNGYSEGDEFELEEKIKELAGK